MSVALRAHWPFKRHLITIVAAAKQSPDALATIVSHANVAATSWEDSREGRRSDCAFRRDFNDNVAHVAIFAANNNTSRLLEGKEKSNNSNSARTHTHAHSFIDNTVHQRTETWHSTTLPCFFFFFKDMNCEHYNWQNRGGKGSSQGWNATEMRGNCSE